MHTATGIHCPFSLFSFKQAGLQASKFLSSHFYWCFWCQKLYVYVGVQYLRKVMSFQLGTTCSAWKVRACFHIPCSSMKMFESLLHRPNSWHTAVTHSLEINLIRLVMSSCPRKLVFFLATQHLKARMSVPHINFISFMKLLNYLVQKWPKCAGSIVEHDLLSLEIFYQPFHHH